MNKSLKIVLFGMLLGMGSCSFTPKIEADPDKAKDELLIDIISFVLDKVHFEARALNDNFSKEVYDEYLETLDPQKRYFYADDIKEFDVYKNELDDQFKNKELTFFNLTYTRLLKRIEESKSFAGNALKRPFDFNKKDSISTNFEKRQYVSSKKEMKERWFKSLKFSSLNNYHEKITEQNADTTTTEKKEFKILEQEAREQTENALKEYYEFNKDLKKEDWFSMYINTIVKSFDPHTNYFAPQDKDRFDISMSGKLEGIGARLQKKNDFIKIVELISGGPAWRGEQLEVGDIITKVKQEDENEPVSIIGMRLDDAVKLIKGPKGTKVSLTVKRVDGSYEVIEIVRDIVELEETYAKSTLTKHKGQTFGLIHLPKFYFNRKDYKERNAAIDVKKEIERLKKQDIEGLVIDLRNNGGGSLRTVVEIAGLFIKEGPVVQVKSKIEETKVLRDTDSSIDWKGPLVIMVNELSASASEILAAAMQDYNRAIVIGSTQTYGKGTVQNFMDLNRWVRNNTSGDLGALKITTSKFYRVNGGSTQLEGVKSDIIVPDKYSYIDIGEKDQENPLAWDKISSAQYEVFSNTNFQEIINRSTARITNNEQLKLIDQNAKWISEQMDRDEFSLNYEDYKSKIEENEAQISFFEKIDTFTTELTFESLPYEKKQIKQDSILGKKRSRWHESLTKDVYVEEALEVLRDLSKNVTK